MVRRRMTLGLLIAALSCLAADSSRGDEPEGAAGDRQGSTPDTRAKPAPEPLRDRVRRLVKQLNDDRFAVRQRAHARILALGDQVLPHLRELPNVTPEARARVASIVRRLQQRFLVAEFRTLGQMADEDIDLDRAMWLIARIVNPGVKKKPLDRQLDELARQVRKRLGPEVVPARVAPRQVVDAIRHVMFQDGKFDGERTNYDHPRNSSLEHVLARRRGLPILLSHVMVSIGERLGVPLVGIQVPGRYMLKYDGRRAPAGFPQEDIVVDPFGGGQILTLEKLQELVPSADAEDLAPSPRRDTVARMLRNLAADCRQVGQLELAGQVEFYMGLVDP